MFTRITATIRALHAATCERCRSEHSSSQALENEQLRRQLNLSVRANIMLSTQVESQARLIRVLEGELS